MASNIKEKKLIYSFDDYTSMPYPSAKNIDYSSSNSFVNSTTLNNTYQQLVDNDLYVAQQLNAKKNYAIGPTILDPTNPEQQIENMQNGEKYYPLSNDVKIYRKVESSLSASIQKHSGFFAGVKRIFKIQQSQALVCMPTQTWIANIGKRGIESVVEVKGPNDQQIAIDCQCSTSAMNMFFGGICNSIRGIYKLDISADRRASFRLAYSLNDGDRQINAIAFRPLDSTMFFSASDDSSSNLYKCTVSETGSLVLSSISRIHHTQSKTITNILLGDTLDKQRNPNECIVLFISDGTIEQSNIGNALDIFEQLDLNTPYINYQQQVNGIDYYATSQGLQYKNGSQLARIGINATTKNFAVDGNALFVGYSNGDIYKVIGTTSSKISSIDGAGISSLQFVNNVLFAATSNSLKYANNGTWHDVLRNGNALACTTAAEQFYSSGTKQYDNIYVGCKVDDRNYLAVVSVDAPIPYESSILSSGMRDVYPQNGNFPGVDVKLFQHGIVKSQDSIEYHVYSLADDDPSGKIVDLTDSQKRSIAQFSASTKYHGSIWVDHAQSNKYAGRVGLFINDTLRVYTSLDISRLQFSNYSLHISFKQAIGNAVDWKIVDSHFLNDSDIIAVVKYKNGTEYLTKLVYLYIDQLEQAVKINNAQLDVFQTNADSSIVCSADNYYVLSSSGSNSYIRSFTTCDSINDFVPLNTNLALTDLDLTATIDLTRQKIVQGIECTYQLNDLQLVGSQQTFDTYQFRRLDFIATNDSTTPLSAIKSIGYSTSEGLMLIKSSLHAIQSSNGIIDVKFAPNKETEGPAFAMLAINANNSMHVIVGLDRDEVDGWCISAMIDNPNRIATLNLPHVHRKTVNNVSDAVIYKLFSDTNSYKLYIAAIQQDHVTLQLLEDGSWTLIANTPAHPNQTIKNIKSYYIDDSRQVIFYTINGVLASYDIALQVEHIYSSTTSIQDVIVAFSEVGQQKDAQSMISFSTLPSFDDWQDDSTLSSDYEFLRDYRPPSRTFLQRIYTSDAEAKIYAIAQSSMHEFIYIGAILQETKTIDFKRLGNSVLANSFSAHQSPYSAFNDVFDQQIYGNQQDFIVFTLGNDRYNLKTYTGKKCLMCNSTSGGNYFSIPASTSIQKFDRDIADNIWLYKNRDDAKTLSVWCQSSHQLMNVGQYVPSSSDEVVYSNNNRGIVAMYVQPSGAGNLSVWTESGSQLNKLPISDKVISMMYKANAPKTPYIAVKQSNASSRIKTFAYEQHYTVNLGFSAVAAVPNNYSIKKIILIDGSPNAYVAAVDADQIEKILYFNYSSQTIAQTQRSFKNIVFSNNIYDGQSYAFAQSSIGTLSCFNNINDQNYLPMTKDGSIGKIAAENSFYPTFLSYRNGIYSLYGRYINDSSEHSIEFKFTRTISNDVMFYTSDVSAYGQTCVHGAIQTSIDDYILAANSGIYKYHFSATGQSKKDCYKVLDGAVCDKPQVMYNGSQTIYLVPDKNSILSSATGFLWGKMVDIGDSTNLSSYMQYNQHILLAGKCNDGYASNGLYYTSYKYHIEDDTPEFTAQSALILYQQNEGQISSTLLSALDGHIAEYHGRYDPASILNSYMPTDFPLGDQAFTKVTNVSSISNDYIERILTGDWTTGEIAATASNSTMQANAKKSIELSYIAKQWKSGLLELFVYLPTTYTYYIPHVDGAGYCTASGNDVQVNGHTIATDISSNATHIQLDILSTYFKLDRVIENTIKGNSLPLKIFKDDTYAEQESIAAKVYHSFVQPSIAKEVDLTRCEYDAVPFDYYCFGSDAQAIYIAAWSPSKNNLKKYKTIIYHGTQSTAQSSIGTNVVYQRFLEEDPQKQIYWDIFSVDNGIFLGWSTDKTATQPDIDNYPEGKTLSYESIDGSTIHLYAVWTFYAFGPSDTAITIQNTSNQTYTIAEITIDPNTTFTENQPLKNRLIVKLED